MFRSLRLSQAQLETLIGHARTCRPEEACGVLAGDSEGNILRVFCMENAAHSSTFYTMDSGEQFRVFDEIRREGLELVAIFHSHPHSPAVPSMKDLELAFYPDSVYLIVSLMDDVPECHAFTIVDGQAYELEISMVEEIANDGESEILQETVDDLLKRLLEELRPLGKLVVAFSGGVDSSVVMAAAARALGPENVIAVTALSETLPDVELREAVELARSLGISHRVIETREMDDEEFRANAPDRCYHCKTELWSKVSEMALNEGITSLADGVNSVSYTHLTLPTILRV